MKNICILGDGIIGMLAALLLSKYFKNIFIVFDRQLNDKQRKTDRFFSINLLSKYMLLKAGIWSDLISADIQSYNKIMTWDEDICEDIIFRSASISYDNLGYIISESKIKDSLISKIDKLPNIKKIDINEIKKIRVTNNIKSLELTNKSLISDALLLNSDTKISEFLGFNSPEKKTIDYQQKALVMNLSMINKTIDSTAFQKFSNGQIQGLLPISNNMYNLIWSAENTFIDALKVRQPKDILEVLNNTFSERIGQIKSLSSLATFSLSGFHVKKYFDKNLAVIGGAAHSVHPMAGLGLNMGIQDIFLLHEAMLDYNNNAPNMDIILSTYEDHCVQENSKIFNTINFLKKFYSKDFLPNLIKSSSISLFNKNSLIKNKIIESATGIDILKRRSRDQYCYPNYH